MWAAQVRRTVGFMFRNHSPSKNHDSFAVVQGSGRSITSGARPPCGSGRSPSTAKDPLGARQQPRSHGPRTSSLGVSFRPGTLN